MAAPTVLQHGVADVAAQRAELLGDAIDARDRVEDNRVEESVTQNAEGGTLITETALDLKRFLKMKGHNVSGSKNELIDRINRIVNGGGGGAEETVQDAAGAHRRTPTNDLPMFDPVDRHNCLAQVDDSRTCSRSEVLWAKTSVAAKASRRLWWAMRSTNKKRWRRRAEKGPGL
jgi:hypothetical protein